MVKISPLLSEKLLRTILLHKKRVYMFTIKSFIENLRRKSVLYYSFTTTIYSVIGHGFGFLVPLFIAAWFGVTPITDAFFFAYSLIIFIAIAFAPSLESVVVPFISELRAKNLLIGDLLGETFAISGIIMSGLAVLILLLAHPILPLVTDFDEVSRKVIFKLLLEFFPLPLLVTWTAILTGTLNSYKNFHLAAFSPGIRAIINISLIFVLKKRYGVHAIAIGYVIGELIRLLVLYVYCLHLRIIHLRLKIHFTGKLREFAIVSSFHIVGLAAVGLNPIIDNTMGSWLGSGTISVLQYANRLYMIPLTLFSRGLVVTLLSHWSGMYYETGGNLRKDVHRKIKILTLISIPILLVLVLGNSLFVKLAYFHGNFSAEKLSEVSWVWICYLIGLIPHVLGYPLSRANLVLKNTKLLMKVFFINFVLNILFNFILMKYWGMYGISLSTSVVTWISLYFLWYGFEKKVRKTNQL